MPDTDYTVEGLVIKHVPSGVYEIDTEGGVLVRVQTGKKNLGNDHQPYQKYKGRLPIGSKISASGNVNSDGILVLAELEIMCPAPPSSQPTWRYRKTT